MDAPNSEAREKQERHKQSRNEGKVSTSNVNEGKLASHSQSSASDIIVYRGAVAIDFPNENLGTTNAMDSNGCIMNAPVSETANK